MNAFKDDKLSRSSFCNLLEDYIETFADLENPLCISINGRFGSGKTTMFRMWAESLQDKYKVFYFNAWKNDFDDDPLSHLASNLLQSQEDTFKKLGSILLDVGNQIVTNKVGIDIKKSFDKRSIYEERKIILDKIKIFFNSLNEETSSSEDSRNKKIIFLVDELDRCKPDYTINILEILKHLICEETHNDPKSAKICFVIGVDREQLSSSVKSLFGENYDFDNYFRRFIQCEFDLPNEKHIHFLAQQINKYGIREIKEGNEGSDNVLLMMNRLCLAMKLQCREIEHIFRLYYYLHKKNPKTIVQVSEDFIFFVCALYIKHKELFETLSSSIVLTENIEKFILDLIEQNSTDRKMELCKRFLYFIYKPSLSEEISQLISNLPNHNDELNFERDIKIANNGLENKSIFDCLANAIRGSALMFSRY